jgi:hypothetical protein
MIDPPPPPTSQANSAEVEINLRIEDGGGFAGTVFTINDKPIYHFGDSHRYSLVLDQGGYLFGYTRGFDTKCSAEVDIEAGGRYVFALKPDCVIELESQ